MVLVQKVIKKVYLGSTQVRPSSTLPNWLIAYYPLQSDANDHKADLGATGTTYNASWIGTAVYDTVWGKKGAKFNGTDYINTWVTCWTYPLTIACFYYNITQSSYKTVMWAPLAWNWAPDVWICYRSSYNYIWYWTSSTWETSKQWTTWRFSAIRIDSNWSVKMNVDNTQTTATTNSFTINEPYYIWAWLWNKYNGCIRYVWIWNRSLSDDELAEYKSYIEWL